MKKSKVFLLFCLLFSCVSLCVIGQTREEQLDKMLTKSFQNSNIPGMAVAIVNKDQVLYQKEFGYADIAAKKPYTQHTIHNIGSTSKTFIGVAIMQLVEQGKLTLDTKVNDVLPFKVTNPYQPNIPITIRQLATHTSSIRDRNFNYGLRAYASEDDTKGNRKGLPLIYKIQFKRMLKNKDVPLGEFLDNTLSEKGKWYKKKNFYKEAPGTSEKYSNIGAALAAYIIEVITRQKYADYVSKNILQPLGMDASGWTYETVSEVNFAKRYIREKVVPKYTLTTYPDGGLISSTADLSKYLMEMIKGYKGESDFLTPASFNVMMRNQYEEDSLQKTISKTEGRSGIFWDIFAKKGKGDIGHSGSDPGILSFMYFEPSTGIGCLLLTNCESASHGQEVVDMWEIIIKARREFE